MAEIVKSFRKIKEEFYGRFDDLSFFNCGEINLLKVVLDGIKVDYVSRGHIRVVTFYPDWLFRLMLKLQRIRKPTVVKAISARLKRSSLAHRPFLVIEPTGRVYEENGKDFSFYNSKIVEFHGRDSVWFVTEGNKRHQHDADTVLPEYSLDLLSALQLSAGFYKLKNSMSAFVKRLSASGKFTSLELQNIRVAVQQFLIQYACWNDLLGNSNATKAYLWPHYHREGCILALRQKGVQVIELQHGLIAEEDIFYGFPQSMKNVKMDMLFAEQIFVYGEFWKNQVLKGNAYSEKQITISGYFPYTPPVDMEKTARYRALFPGKRIILVTTQTFLHESFVMYVQFLSDDILRRKEEYAILVKLHPAEKRELYSGIESLANVEIVNDSIDTLLRVADLHVSIYSTTMFDAIRSGVPNFSIYHPDLAEYIEMFEREGISTVIQPDENPIDHSSDARQQKDIAWYYAPFDPKVLI